MLSFGLLVLLTAAPARAEGPTVNPCLQPDRRTYFSVKPNCDSTGYWNGHPYHLRTNSVGLREREVGPHGKKPRIVMVGSSELFGPGLEQDELPSVSFSRALGDRYEVINAGIEGFTTVQHLIDFRAAVLDRFQPDIIVYTLSSSAIFGNATQALFARESPEGPELLFFPKFLWPFLSQWPRLTKVAFMGLREVSELGAAYRTRFRQWFAHDDTFDITASYLSRLRKLAAERGVKFVVARYGAPRDYVLNVHFRKYTYPGAVRWVMDTITPRVRADVADFERAMRAEGVEFLSFREEERDRIFQGSLSNDLHVNADGARAFGSILAEKFAGWAGPAAPPARRQRRDFSGARR